MSESEELLAAALQSAPPVSGVPEPRYVDGAEPGPLRVKLRCGQCGKLLAELYDYDFTAQSLTRPVLHSRISGRTSIDLISPSCPLHPKPGPSRQELLAAVEDARKKNKPATRKV